MTAQTPGCGCNSEARKRQAERQAEHFVEVIDWLATPPISAKVPPVPASQHEPDRQWMNQAEAAEYLGVTDRTIRAYIARADLPARRIKGSRLVRVAKDDLDRLLEPISPEADR